MSEENKATTNSDPEEVLSYWFPEDINNADLETLRREGKRWMQGGPEVDKEITERFGGVLEQARRGELDHWADTPRGRLTLIIVLDQFSRNIYRGSPLSYSQDEKALKLAFEGIDLGMDRELTPVERNFFWLPLGHSEDLALHERGGRHARGGSGQHAAPPQGDGRVRDLSGQGSARRHSPLRSPPTPQRDTGADLYTGEAGVPEDRDATAPASASFLLSPYSPKCLEVVVGFREVPIRHR